MNFSVPLPTPDDSRKTMNVSLTAELELFVTERVASGLYRSASEVVRAASACITSARCFI
jgi:hypothetical protein